MAGKMVYDFETALNTLINAQSDVMVLVQKWGEMLASTPKDVTFTLKGQDGTPVTYTIPNIQKVIDTIGTRTLPANPTFNSVTLSGQSGSGRITNGALEFSGVGAAAQYTAAGMAHQVTEFTSNTVLEEWPIPRCWRIGQNTHPVVTVSPSIPDGDAAYAADFFVHAPAGASVQINFTSYGSSQRMNLVASSASVWHVFMTTRRVPNAGRSILARAVRLNIINNEDG